VAGRGDPVRLAAGLLTVAPDLVRRAQASGLGATDRVASRRLAVRLPEAVVKARRSIARQTAKKNGDTPAHAPRTLLAWHLLLTPVPPTSWTTATIPHVSPRRWHSALIVTSWQRSLQFAALPTTTEDST